MLNLAETTAVSVVGGGVYANLFDAHPPFQIDRNFGATAGIAEQLVQSHAGEISLLPALPPTWRRGRVTGLCARGGFEVDIDWHDGWLRGADVRSRRGGLCRLRAPLPISITRDGVAVVSEETEPGVASFTAEAGGKYGIVPRPPA